MARLLDEVEADDATAEAILRDCLQAFDTVRLRVTGDCMSPAVQPGDVVTVTTPGRRAPRLGDVVLVRAQDGLRLHRLVPGWPHGGSWLRLKADRAPHWDAPIGAADLIGTVVRLERAGCARPPRGVFQALRSAARGLASRLRPA